MLVAALSSSLQYQLFLLTYLPALLLICYFVHIFRRPARSQSCVHMNSFTCPTKPSARTMRNSQQFQARRNLVSSGREGYDPLESVFSWDDTDDDGKDDNTQSRFLAITSTVTTYVLGRPRALMSRKHTFCWVRAVIRQCVGTAFVIHNIDRSLCFLCSLFFRFDQQSPCVLSWFFSSFSLSRSFPGLVQSLVVISPA